MIEYNFHPVSVYKYIAKRLNRDLIDSILLKKIKIIYYRQYFLLNNAVFELFIILYIHTMKYK